jgi:multisubunit Na+/H+ antiporter MnhF subunit
MSFWLAACGCLFLAFLVPAFAASRGNSDRKVIAGQAAGILMTFILAAGCFAIDQTSLLDLALALGLINLTAALALEHLL